MHFTDRRGDLLTICLNFTTLQCAKKVVSDSPGLVDFAIGLVNSIFNLPDGQVMILSNLSKGRTVKSILLVKKLLGLVEMTSGLVNAINERSCSRDANAQYSVFVIMAHKS